MGKIIFSLKNPNSQRLKEMNLWVWISALETTGFEVKQSPNIAYSKTCADTGMVTAFRTLH